MESRSPVGHMVMFKIQFRIRQHIGNVFACQQKLNGKIIEFVCTGIGWTISVLGVIQLPIWGFAAVVRQKGHGCQEKLVNSFRPQADWGPSNPAKFEEYQKYINSYESQRELLPRGNLFVRIKRNVFG